MTITLPIPNPKLSPNARCHWRAKSPLTKSARTLANHLAKHEYANLKYPYDFNAYRLTFYWPDKRRRDDDNASGSCKAYRDGIADALGIDDHSLKFHGPPVMLHDKDNPRLVVELFNTALLTQREG